METDYRAAMLRRRFARLERVEDVDEDKGNGTPKKAPTPSFRVLLATWLNTIWIAMFPPAEIRSAEYNSYLTSQVKRLTFGWHAFRALTESTFLAGSGFAADTVAVQVFATMSWVSVLLHTFAYDTWLKWRESMCVYTNIIYALVTILKIFHLLPRLPNENLFLFKFCFLTMADAAFSQTPVHRQWVAQVADAVIRVEVWRRYSVLPDQPLWAVLIVSLAWQLWLLTFTSLLQANHVRAFMRQRNGPSASGSAPSTSTAAAASAPSTSASAPGPSSSAPRAPASDAPYGITTAAASTSASCNPLEIEPGAKRGQDAHSNGHAAGVQGPAPVYIAAAAAPTSARQSRSPGSARASPPAAAAAADAAGAARSASAQRYMRSLRALARGPSSYVLLSQQRKQSGVQTATAQLYVSGANPEMLLHDWRERLGADIAEGAPGWHVANACVRKGSLIVHLDLVYVPPGTTFKAAAAEAAAARAGAVTTTHANSVTLNPMQHIPYTPFVLNSEITGELDGDVSRGRGIDSQDGRRARTVAVQPEGSTPEVAALDSYMSGMGAEQLLALLGLEAGLEGTGGAGPEAGLGAVAPVQLQRGDRVMELKRVPMGAVGGEVKAGGPECAAVASVGNETMQQPGQLDAQQLAREGVGQQQPKKREDDDKEVTVAAIAASTTPGAPSSSQPPPSSAGHPSHPSPLLAGVRALTHPHPALSTPEYTAFLHSRTSGIHAAYTSFICSVAVAFATFRPASGMRMSCLLLYLAAELLSTAARLTLRPGTWARARVRCVHVGLVLRTAQMIGHVYGNVPQLHPEEDCVSGRWISKTLVFSALQVVCMQCPVRPLFALRLPSVLLIMHVHATLCRASMSLAALAALHLGWEGCMLLLAAWMQQRHLDAFLEQRREGKEQSLSDSIKVDKGYAATTVAAEAGGEATAEAAAAPVTGPAPCTAPPAAAKEGEGDVDVAQLLRAAARGLGSGEGMEGVSPFDAQAVFDAARGPWSVVHPPLPDPTAVALDRRVVQLAPRRAARLQLSFSAAPVVVDELSVVLRHVHPASMASGVHAAHAVRDIVRSLGTPAAAAAAPRHVPLPFTADLTLVAAAVDVPGVAYVELWRGRRRIASLPALLVAPSAISDTAAADTASSDTSTVAWIQEVAAYIATLENDGHVTAAEQYIEEAGAWLAQVAAVQLGMVGGKGPNVGLVNPRIANFLYFHGSGTEYMFIKPTAESTGIPPSDSPRGPSSKASPPPPPAAADDPHRDGLRAVLVSQGGMLLAVAVEAGCLALSRHVMGLMRGPLGVGLGAVLQSARTPVTQLPLLHAAVKSGCADVVDLVVAWLREAGVEDMWAHEAAVLALGLASPAPTVTHGGGSAAPSNPISGSSTRSSVLLLHQIISARIGTAGTATSGAPIVRPAAFGLKHQPHLAHKSHDQQGSMLLSPEPSAGSSVVHAGSNNTVLSQADDRSRALQLGLEGSDTSAAGVIGSFQLGSDMERAAGQQDERGGGGGRPVGQLASPVGAAYAGGGVEPQSRSDEIEEALVEGSEGPFRIVSFRAAVRGKGGNVGGAAGDCGGIIRGGDGGKQAQLPGGEEARGVPGNRGAASGGHRPSAEEADKAVQMPREELKPHPAPGAAAAPVAASAQLGASAAAAPVRRSLELYDGGVLVLTPLHLCMALGDGGRLAAHVLHTYPEANQLWRQGVEEPTLHDMQRGQSPMHQQDQQHGQQHHAAASVCLPGEASGPQAQERVHSGGADADSGDFQPVPQSACGGADHGSGPYDFAGVSEDSSHVTTTSWCLPSNQTGQHVEHGWVARTINTFEFLPPGVNTSLHLSYPLDGSAGALELPCVHEHGQQGALPYDSAQGGKGAACQGLEGGGAGIHAGVGEGASADAPRSLTLSEVAYLEGFRWVDEDAGSRRPGAHIARLVQ